MADNAPYTFENSGSCKGCDIHINALHYHIDTNTEGRGDGETHISSFISPVVIHIKEGTEKFLEVSQKCVPGGHPGTHSWDLSGNAIFEK